MRMRGAAQIPGAKPAVAPAVRGDEPVTDELAAEGSRSHPARRDELKLCGLAAVRARFARDPSSIQRLFFDHATGQRVGIMCKVLAQAKKIYRQVEPAELEKISGSIHHGGIVAVVTPPPLREPTADDAAKWAKRGEALLVLDCIGNAHNLGAIARTAAFFGVARLVIPDHPGAAKPSDAAHRVAEGGFEHLEVWQTKDLVGFTRELATAGYDVVGAATRGGRPDAPRTGERKPLALVLGNEEEGLAPEVAAVCTRLVTIPGAGKVESLNVSVAAAVLMWELFARRTTVPAAR
jgi:TrmH RNA methyltransferase